MSAITGTNVQAPIVPMDSADTYPTHLAEYGRGGCVPVSTYSALANIPLARREIGMLACAQDTGVYYTLQSGNVWAVAIPTVSGTTNTVAKFTGSNTIGNGIVTDNGSTVTVGGALSVNTTISTGGTITSGNAVNAVGAVSSGGNISATGNISSSSGTVSGSTVSGGTVSSTGALSAGGNISTVNGNITTSNGAITASTGSISAGGAITAGGNISTTSGTVSGSTVTATSALTSGGNISTVNGNITSSNGTITAATGNVVATAGNVSAGGDIFRAQFQTYSPTISFFTDDGGTIFQYKLIGKTCFVYFFMDGHFTYPGHHWAAGFSLPYAYNTTIANQLQFANGYATYNAISSVNQVMSCLNFGTTNQAYFVLSYYTVSGSNLSFNTYNFYNDTYGGAFNASGQFFYEIA